jgi:hypothetical protein
VAKTPVFRNIRTRLVNNHAPSFAHGCADFCYNGSECLITLRAFNEMPVFFDIWAEESRSQDSEARRRKLLEIASSVFMKMLSKI